ncbi:prolipoprotein diacylglyceryl transferase [Aerococcus loyolae]|uniref:Phosphatidylglycerol--prolipoprotein diacylglyceryl transferase n=1 Tax=Aerococcus loyolae TaxID=2976809 RepID=A0ABT4BYI3_9LACT|nr:prolipoprotein diacylglyceryl transferase [Aerococcus loyolae]MCY3025332.1 prolipoprotein diacylglyceryl transferase [Aerococcus loyolae]MCY3027394.1 prolipoprotein diacylglyceryl transferase [Aerococcus loyolae]MCY3029131.1 prolipoprotein diacylglyceryl transferase [Aerococcus loyolae]
MMTTLLGKLLPSLNLLAIDPVAFSFLGIEIRWYGIIIALGMFLAVELILKEIERKGFDSDQVMDMIMWAVPIGFIGARLYYVIFEWDYYRENLGEIIAIWQGGIAIYGGVIAGALTAIIYAKRHEMKVSFLADVIMPYLLLAQGIGRWGNFVNQEAHGGPVSEGFLQETLHLPNFIVEQMSINGQYYHPTFLYESLWNLLGVGVLLFLRHRHKTLKLGETGLLYLIWYGTGRFFIEGLRTDSLYLGPIRVSQALSLVLVLMGIALFIYRRTKEGDLPYYSDYNYLSKRRAQVKSEKSA